MERGGQRAGDRAGLPSSRRFLDSMISAQGITKRYGSLLAVDNVGFEVGTGDAIGFIETGAGKSTTMRILTGYLPASEGRALIMGTTTPRTMSVAVRSAICRRLRRYKELTMRTTCISWRTSGGPSPGDLPSGRCRHGTGRISGWEDASSGRCPGYRQRVGAQSGHPDRGAHPR